MDNDASVVILVEQQKVKNGLFLFFQT